MTSTLTRGLSHALLDRELLSLEDYERAVEEQARTGEPLGQVLIDLGLFTEASFAAALAEHLGLEFVELGDLRVDTLAAIAIPERLARRHCVLPFAFDEDDHVLVAMSDPSNVLALDDVRTLTDRPVRPVVAARSEILVAIDRYIGMGDSVEKAADQFSDGEDEDAELGEISDVVDDAPVVRFVNALIAKAVHDRASDIHIEPQERHLCVRFRVDGVLHDITEQSRRIHSGVVSRLKIMADLDIAERRMPQDGRISLRAGGKSIDLRVSTLPTMFGEKIVLRILDKTSALLKLSDLGFLDHNYERYGESFHKPYGMILVTGPTGSGKSTTLYATLNILNKRSVNIVTVEDPVEYQIPGIAQVQVNPKAGLTFARALRSILRQDPDVVLIGEMRDRETAQIAMEAALTGHLVLATLHTNDAPSAATRLTEMGIDPFLVGSAVDCVLGQRLVRQLCQRCREPYEPTHDQLRAAGLPVEASDTLPTLYRPKGCPSCVHTGYRGRMAVHEVMQVSDEIEQLIVRGASTDEIARVAHGQGMTRLRQDGLVKVLQGQTTFEEIARVVV